MSPLAAPPNRGYADWQRISNWDGDPLWTANGLLIGGSVGSGLLDVSRYGYLGGQIKSTDNLGKCTIQWFADAGQTILLGERILTISGNIGNALQLRVPNMGPYAVVTFNTAGQGAWHCNVNLIRTNRYHPCEAIPWNSFALAQTQVVAGGSQVAYYPFDYVAGPAKVIVENGGGNSTATMQTADTNGASLDFDFSGPIASSPFTFDTVIPLGHWRVLISNASGVNQTVFVLVTPSFTGST